MCVCSVSSCREVREGTQARSLDVGSGAKVMKKCCLLVCSVCFLIQPGPPNGITNGINQNRLGLSISSINKEKMPSPG